MARSSSNMKMIAVLRSAGNFTVERISNGTVNNMPSRTIQSGKEETDVNTIVRRFAVTGMLPQVRDAPTYQDFADTFDFQSAMNVVRRGEAAFAALPADVRKRFGNDPGEFLTFMHDEKNIPEARILGLIPKEEVKPVVDVKASGVSDLAGK